MAKRGLLSYKHIPFKQTVEPLTGYELEEDIPFDGYITAVLMHFPDGCNALVDVAVNVEHQRVIPERENEFIALNDATPIFQCNFPVRAGNRIITYINNHDDTYPHAISVIVTIKTER